MNPDHASNAREAWLDLQSVEAWIDGHRIVNNLSLQLWAGESTAILGRNGAGKSTLVKLITRNLYPVVQPSLIAFKCHRPCSKNRTVDCCSCRATLDEIRSGWIRENALALSGQAHQHYA